MSDDLSPGLLRFKVHGPEGSDRREVPAAVFAQKLAILVRALKAADRAMNDGAANEYTIASLNNSSPTAVLRERPMAWPLNVLAPKSGIEGFASCANAVIVGDPAALNFGKCAKEISLLARGAKKGFDYAEVWTDTANVIRVDAFLAERAEASINPEAGRPTVRGWFKGAAIGAFDGVLRMADLRGALPEIKLALSAGGKEIDCVCKGVAIPTIGAALNRRVRVSGRAIYDGNSGLPRRVEVTHIEPVKEEVDFTRWKGAFERFEIPDWDGGGD